MLFFPSYSFAKTPGKSPLSFTSHILCFNNNHPPPPDPISGKDEIFMTVGLNSSMDTETFSRKPLNLVLVLDISGSMGSCFTSEGSGKNKLQIAQQVIISLLDHLKVHLISL